MVRMANRMRRLRERLLQIRVGDGAAILSGDVQKINLRFAKKWNDGHFGPRKFWHEMLPRLKYHNPAVPMTVERMDDNKQDATLTVFFVARDADESKLNAPTQSTSGDKIASEHKTWDRTQTIDMKHKHESAILDALLKVTNGKKIEPTEEDLRGLEEMKERAAKSEVDRAEQKRLLDAERREKRMLEEARQSV